MSEEEKLKTNNEKVTINYYYYYYLLKCEDALNELEKEIISQIEICKEGQVLETKARSPFDTYSGDIRAYKYLLYKLKELKENNK